MQRRGRPRPGERAWRVTAGSVAAVALAALLILAPVAGATGNLTGNTTASDVENGTVANGTNPGDTNGTVANESDNATEPADGNVSEANRTENATSAAGNATAGTENGTATETNATRDANGTTTPNGTSTRNSTETNTTHNPTGTNATGNATGTNTTHNATDANTTLNVTATETTVSATDGPRNVTIIEYRLDSGEVVNRTRSGAERTTGTDRYLDGTVPARDGGVVDGERSPGRERVESTREYPWSAIAQVDADFGEMTGGCSATLIDDNHVLTAAHCVYNHEEGGWASDLTVSPGANLQSRLDHPLDDRRGATFPFGRAEAERVQTYERWVDDRNRGFDVAVVTLDRNVGDYTGTFGLAGYPDSNERYTEPAHASGYPTNPPRDPSVTLWDDYGNTGGTTSAAFLPDLGCLGTDLCHSLSMTLSGGQSGGPVWQNRTAMSEASTPFVLSVNAAGYEAFGVPLSLLPTTGVRITDGKFGDIRNMMTRGDDAGLADDSPDLRGAGRYYTWHSREQVVANESTLAVRVGVLNRGTATAGSFDVSYRAVSASDGTSVTLGTETVDGVAPFDDVVNATWTGTVPTMEAGTYRLIAEIDANDDVEEFSEYGANVSVGEVSVRAAPENNTLLDTRGALTTGDPYRDDRYNRLNGYHDNYTVSVEEGELLNAHVRPDASHENYAQIVLYEPDGDLAGEYDDGPEGDAVFSKYVAQESGRYTVAVTNGGGEDTFGYDLHAYTGRPADYAVGYGTEIEGEISDTDNYYSGLGYPAYEGYHDVVTFKGRAGDTVSAVARPNKSHENSAELVLYQPDGDRVAFSDRGDEGDAVLSRHTLQENGTYRMVITAGSATNEFDYDFRLYEGLPAERTLAYGTNLSERIGTDDRYLQGDPSGYHDTYAFQGRTGDVVSAEMRPNKSHENDAQLVLYQPDGDRVAFSRRGDEGDAVISRHTLQESGRYKLVATSDSADTFDYDLRFYEGLPVDGGLERGRTLTSELDTGDDYLYGDFSGYHETYAFDAEGGDTVSIEMRPRTGSEADAELLLFSPNGTLVTRGADGDGGNEVVSRFTLPDVDGTYRLVATSGSRTAAFGYDLTLYGDLPPESTLDAGTWTNGEIETTDRYLRGDPSGYHDTYAFDGTAGERVHVRVNAPKEYDGEAKALLYAPNGTLLEQREGNVPGNDAVLPPRTLRTNGTYKVIVTGDSYADTLDYSVRVDEHVPADGNLTYGETVNATVDGNDTYLLGEPNGYHDVYTFHGEAGDVVNAAVRPGSGYDRTYDYAKAALVDPDGTVVARGRGNGPDREGITPPRRLRQNGTYRVVVTGDNREDTFNYDLRLYEGYPAEGDLSYGDWANGSVADDDRYLDGVRSGYHDTYTFDGEAGETVGLNVQVPTDSYDDPAVVLLGPNGSVVAEDRAGAGVGDDAALSRVELPDDGTYRVVVTGYSATDTFDYDLHLYESLAPEAELGDGDRVAGNVTTEDPLLLGVVRGYYDTYAFEGTAGERTTLEVRADDSYVGHARVALVAPNGTRIAYDEYGDGAGNDAILERVNIPENGTYKVVVTGDGYGDTFGYDLHRYDSFATDGNLSYGGRGNGSVTADDPYLNGAPNGYHDAYTFEGETGDNVSIEARADLVSGNARLALFAPNGSLVAEDEYGDGIDDGALLADIDLPTNGSYTAVVSADGGTTTFDYDLRLYEGATVDGELTYGDRTSGAVTVGDPYYRSGVGFHDLYAFKGEAGDEVSVEVRTDADGVTAGAVLYGPDGSVVADDYGGGADDDAVISLETLPANGTYRIAVAGESHDSTFDYDLRLDEGITVNGELSAGETRNRHLDSGDRFLNGDPYNGYHEVFTFDGEAGETTTIEARVADPLEQQVELRLYQPDGDEASEARYNGDGGNAVIGRHTLLESGEYTVVVTGAGTTETFRYDLSRYNGLPADDSLLYGDTVESEVTTADNYLHGWAFSGYHDVYAFNASAGETVSLNVSAEDATDVDPRLTLYEQDGDEVAQSRGSGYTALEDIEIIEGGTHRVVVTSVNTDAMEYTLNLSGPDNNPPRALGSADPGAVAVGNTVHLDGTDSNDPDGDALNYRWTQDDGPDVALRDAGSARAAFSAPNVSDGTELSFELRVTDAEGKTDTTEVRVTVHNETDRPVVRAASRTGAADYTTAVPLTLSEAPTGVSGFTVVATVADPSVASVTNATLADAFAAGTVTVGPDNESVRVAGVDFEERIEPGDENVALGAVNLTGGTRGETTLALRVVRLDDDHGEGVAAGTNAGTFRVPDVASVVPPRVPSDPDRDGLYEDVNGNDALDMDDAVELFRGLSAGQDAIVDHPGPYDFNDNDELDADDAVELFHEIVSTERTGPETAVATGEGARVASAAVESAASDAGGPTVRLSNVSLGPNGTADATLRLSRAPDGLSGFDVRVSAANGSVVNVTGVTVAERFQPSLSAVGTSNGSARVAGADFDANVGAGAENVALGTVSLAGVSKGETELQVHVARADDDSGGAIAPTDPDASAIVMPNQLPDVQTLTPTVTTHVGAPTRIAGVASDPDGTVTNVTLELPDGSVIGAGTGNEWTSEVRFGRSTWEDGSYERVPVQVRAVDNDGAANATAVRTRVFIAGDATGDGVVDIFDAVAVGQNWDTGANVADMNNDGEVDAVDAAILGQNWNETAG